MKSTMVMVMILLLCGTTAEDTGGPMFQHDPQHSGYSSSPMPESLREVWVNESFVGDGDFNLSYAISGETLFVSRYSSLCALDVNTGSVMKEYDIMPAMGYPAIEDKKICLNANHGALCLDSTSGEKLWIHFESFLTLYSYPITVDGHVFIGGGIPGHPDFFTPKALEEFRPAMVSACRVMCFDVDTGEIVWEFYANGWTSHSPAYFSNRIYMDDDLGYLYCLDAQTGKKIWEKETYWNSNSSLSVDGERIFLGTYDGILCHDMETGNMLWRFRCDNYIHGTPATAYGKVFASSDRILSCLDAGSGKLKWKREVKNPISTELVVADGKVAFGTAEGMLYIVKAGSGKVCESLDLGDSPIIALALSNGKLIVGEEDGRITCFEGTSKPLTEYLLVFIVVVAGAALLIAPLKWYQKEGILVQRLFISVELIYNHGEQRVRSTPHKKRSKLPWTVRVHWKTVCPGVSSSHDSAFVRQG